MKWLLYPVLVVLTSFYIFPVSFYFFPAANTKMIMAVLGVVTFIVNSIVSRKTVILSKVINVAICAFLVSFWGIISVLFNGTNDYNYASYFMSFVVWLAAAYFVISCIKSVHGYVTVKIVCNYLIAVAISQCFLAIALDLLPAFKNVINNYIVGFASMASAGDGLEKAGRLYGIGAALDVAGTRFSAILSVIGIMAYSSHQSNKTFSQIVYMLSLIILLVVGSMISRTTGIGVLFIVVYFVVVAKNGSDKKSFLIQFLITCSLLTFACVILYNMSPFFYDNLRFAFEGFFNLFETGEWSLQSTDALQDMYRFPDSMKTWIIGDGYFEEPYRVDPYYVGEARGWGLFYMGTDVGYIRFLYYFGCLGLFSFMFYFIRITKESIADFPKEKWVFYALLFINFTIWLKVATDIFCLFALFLCISKEDNDAYEKQYENPVPDQLDI